MPNFYPGIVGARGRNPSGVVIHNDAGSQAATAAFYQNWLPTHDAYNGFAHYYVGDGIYQAENEKNMAWHTANATGNANYIGIEACQSMGDETTFKENEQASFKLAADILKRYGLSANRETVMLHQEFVATSCPHRSWELHGAALNAVKDYYILEIQKYMNGDAPKPEVEKPKTKEEITMICFYQVDKKGPVYYFDGQSVRGLAHPDEQRVLNDIYRANNGKDIPTFQWTSKAPWHARLLGVVNRKAMK